MSCNIKAHHKLHLKVIVTFMEGYWSKLLHTTHSLKQCATIILYLFIIIILRNNHIHIRVLIQRYTSHS